MIRVLAGLALSALWIAAQATPSSIAAPAGGAFFGLTPQFAVSPDGRQVVAVVTSSGGTATLWVQPVSGGGAARLLAGTDQASYPFWSPDNRFVGFFAAGKLKKAPAGGGAVVVVCDAPTGRGGTWNTSDVIVFASGIGDPLRRVQAAGGQPVSVTTVDTSRENSHRWPQFLPDGTHFLFWAGAGSAPAELKVGSLDAPESVSLVTADTNGAFSAGYVFYGSRNVLMAQPFDAATQQKRGDPVKVVDPLSGDAGSNFASFSASANGTLLYTRGTARPLVLTWFDRTGKRLGTVGAPGQYTNVAFSPDDTRLAVSLTAGMPPNRDVWVLDAASGTASRLTTDPAVDATPIWNGDYIFFSSQRAGPYQMYKRMFGGEAFDELILKSDVATIATDVSRDGKFILYIANGQDHRPRHLGVVSDLRRTANADGPDAGRGGQRRLCSRWRMDRLSIQSIGPRRGVRAARTRPECDVAGRAGLQEWRHAAALARRREGAVFSGARWLGHVRGHHHSANDRRRAAAEIVFGAPCPW